MKEEEGGVELVSGVGGLRWGGGDKLLWAG